MYKIVNFLVLISSTEISTNTTNQTEREILANTEIRQIIEDCFGQRDNSKKYLVTIQGCSSSGKSTIADNIRDVLVKNGVEVYMLSLDSFYKTYTHSVMKEYDFDNPGALDWEKIDEVLGALSRDDEFIPTYQYSFISKVCDGPIYIKNKKPSVIIMEGIYAFNSINDYKFNIGEFDPLQSKKVIGNEFVKNETKFDFKILKVKLSMCKSKSLAVRIERDSKQRNKPKEASLLQFENQVWPATIKWVNNPIFKQDIAVVHGSFNEQKAVALIEELAKYFTGKTVNVDAIMCEKNLEHYFSVSCSGECQSNLEK